MATVFLTLALAHRGTDLLAREVGRLRQALAATRRERPFAIDAWGERQKRNRPVDGFSRERAKPRARCRSRPGRGGFRGACQVLLDQSGQARVPRPGSGLAVFVHSSGDCVGASVGCVMPRAMLTGPDVGLAWGVAWASAHLMSLALAMIAWRRVSFAAFETGNTLNSCQRREDQ